MRDAKQRLHVRDRVEVELAAEHLLLVADELGAELAAYAWAICRRQLTDHHLRARAANRGESREKRATRGVGLGDESVNTLWNMCDMWLQ